MNFGTQLRAMRAIRNLSQVALADLTGIPNTYISDMEMGKVMPNPQWEADLRAALDWPEAADEAFAILAGAPEPAGVAS